MKHTELSLEIRRRYGSPSELSRTLGVSTQAVALWCRRGYLPTGRAIQLGLDEFAKDRAKVFAHRQRFPTTQVKQTSRSIENMTVREAIELYRQLKEFFREDMHVEPTPHIRASTEAVDSSKGDGRASA